MSEALSPVLAPRYVSRFSCIGSACESTCCKGWTISIDSAHHREIRRALQQTKADRELFESSVKRARGTQRTKHFALIVLNPKTSECQFLDDEKLCGLQRRFGPKLLPNTCATYPRRQSFVGERVEMALSLSCPEAAREALLHHDAMELTDLPDDTFRPATGVQELVDRGPYDRALDVGRLSILEILSGASSSSAGLATVAALAQVLGEDFARGKNFDEARAESLFADFKDPAQSKALASQLSKIDVPIDVAMEPLLRVFAQRFALMDPTFLPLAGLAAVAYGISEKPDVASIAKRYEERRDAVLPLVGARLDEMVRNFAMNYTFTSWFTEAPSFAVWVRGLIVRTALLRFLVFAHPSMEALQNGATPADARTTVERVTVMMVSKLGRAIEHNQPFIEMLDVSLPQSMPGLEHALCMLRI